MLNNLNLELQGQDKHAINMISSVNIFKRKLQLLLSSLQWCEMQNFPHMQAELQRHGKDSAQLDSGHYDKQIHSILSESEKHFTDFTSFETVASYLCFSFWESIDVDYIASKVPSLFQLDSSAVENEILT